MTPVEIPFATLRPQHEALAPELRAAMDRVLGRAWFVLGEEVAAFEQEFAASVGAAHAVGVASGTDAISLMLLAHGVAPGDEVIFPANTCPATLTGIAATGATPVPVDVDEDTMTLSPDAVKRALTPQTRAVVAVHLYGHPADMDALAAVLEGSGVALLEDAAQAHGARSAGRCCGSLGSAAAFSFYPSKNLGACGDGGAVTTSDAAVAERLRALRNYGEGARYTLAMPGMNSRLDEVQAAILRAKLPHLEAWNARRALLARRYREGLAGLPLKLPPERPGYACNHHLFVVRTARRDALAVALRERGIATQAHYPTPAHRHPAYPMPNHPQGSLPVAERLCREVLSLPLYPEMPEAHVDRVVEGIAAFFKTS